MDAPKLPKNQNTCGSGSLFFRESFESNLAHFASETFNKNRTPLSTMYEVLKPISVVFNGLLKDQYGFKKLNSIRYI